MVTNGGIFDVNAEEVTRAALDGFTDLTQICVRCPLHHGILDGIILSLRHLLIEVFCLGVHLTADKDELLI